MKLLWRVGAHICRVCRLSLAAFIDFSSYISVQLVQLRSWYMQLCLLLDWEQKKKESFCFVGCKTNNFINNLIIYLLLDEKRSRGFHVFVLFEMHISSIDIIPSMISSMMMIEPLSAPWWYTYNRRWKYIYQRCIISSWLMLLVNFSMY